MSGGKTNYKATGVDIDAGNEAVDRIKDSLCEGQDQISSISKPVDAIR